MAELTREQVEDMRECLHAFESHYDAAHISALCDLALRALEQTNAAGQEVKCGEAETAEFSPRINQGHTVSDAPESTEITAPTPAAPHLEPTVVWGPPQPRPDGTWYRVGTSTGATLPEQPHSEPQAQVNADEVERLESHYSGKVLDRATDESQQVRYKPARSEPESPPTQEVLLANADRQSQSVGILEIKPK